MPTGRALGEVGRRLDEQLLDKQVVLDRVAEEDRRVDVGIVERARVGLVLEQGRTIDAEHLQRQSGSAAEPRVGSGVRRAVGEADERVVRSGRGIDALRVLGGKPIQYLDLGPDQSVAFGVGVADGAAGAFGRDGLGDVTLRLSDHGLQVLIEPGIDGFDVRRVFDERGRRCPPHYRTSLLECASRRGDRMMSEAALLGG